MCWAAKWLGDKDIYFDSVQRSGAKNMLQNIYAMLEEADAVIHYNGSRFDIPTLNKEFLLYGMSPPSTYAQIDLLRTARNQFRFPSNKLDYIARSLKVGSKTKHAGHELWVRCLAGEKQAWKEMEEYNINDVHILERVYSKLLPWIKNHPSHGVIDGKEDVCPNCGSHHIQKRGFSYTAAGKYQRYQCTSCFTWCRGRKSEAVKDTITHAR